jgi:hypothetical protein
MDIVLPIALSLAFVDIGTGLLHILLDDPNTLKIGIPLVAQKAKEFQMHHETPFILSTSSTVDLLNSVAIFSVPFWIASFYFIWNQFRCFYVTFFGMSALGILFCQYLHAISHTPLSRIPAPFLPLAAYLKQVHMQHHKAFDCNFNILIGWFNPITNCIYHRILRFQTPVLKLTVFVIYYLCGIIIPLLSIPFFLS